MNVLITGANRGLGLSLVRTFLDKGDRVVALCRRSSDKKALNDLIMGSEGRLMLLEINDLTSMDCTVLDKIKVFLDTLDIVINNAGINARQLDKTGSSTTIVGEFRRSDFLKMFDVNSVSPLMLVQFLLPIIPNNKRSKIVFISSRDASFGVTKNNRSFAYAASKVALNMFAKFLSEYEGNTRTVLAIHPGWIQTQMGGPLAPEHPDNAAKKLASTISCLDSGYTGKFINFDGTFHAL